MRTPADACFPTTLPLPLSHPFPSPSFTPFLLLHTAWFTAFVRPTGFFPRVGSVRASAGRSISIHLTPGSIFRTLLNARTTRRHPNRDRFLFEANRLQVFLERSPASRSPFKISAGPTILGHGISTIPPRWNALLDSERMDPESRSNASSWYLSFELLYYTSNIDMYIGDTEQSTRGELASNAFVAQFARLAFFLAVLR